MDCITGDTRLYHQWNNAVSSVVRGCIISDTRLYHQWYDVLSWVISSHSAPPIRVIRKIRVRFFDHGLLGWYG